MQGLGANLGQIFHFFIYEKSMMEEPNQFVESQIFDKELQNISQCFTHISCILLPLSPGKRTQTISVVH